MTAYSGRITTGSPVGLRPRGILGVMRHWTPRGTRPAMAAIGRESSPGNARSGHEAGKRGENG